MGVLRDHAVEKLIPLGYSTFCETGTGRGTALNHARGLAPDGVPFSRLYSCDCDTEQVARLADQYSADPRIRLFPMTSDLYLEALLAPPGEGVPAIITPQDKVVWFLDSHFPGFDLHGAAIDAEKDLKIRLPLHSELEALIRHGRHLAGDVVVIDDLRVYERGPFKGGNMDEIGYGHAAAYDHPLPFGPWEATHVVRRRYDDTGYVTLIPRSLGGLTL